MHTKQLIGSGAVIIVAMLALSAWASAQLPADASVPVHWDINGVPDRYGGTFEGLLVIPIIAAVLTVVLALAPRLDPRRLNLEASANAYLAICLATLLLMGLVHAVVIFSTLGLLNNGASLILAGVGALFVVIGAVLGQTQRNYVAGIRTPWTLESERSWGQTHRLGGRLILAQGLLVILAAVLWGPAGALVLLLTSMVAIMSLLFVYSYLVWRSDPERAPHRS
jgi:uncharacterized membrane protein